jgi:hypothetical protein
MYTHSRRIPHMRQKMHSQYKLCSSKKTNTADTFATVCVRLCVCVCVRARACARAVTDSQRRSIHTSQQQFRKAAEKVHLAGPPKPVMLPWILPVKPTRLLPGLRIHPRPAWHFHGEVQNPVQYNKSQKAFACALWTSLLQIGKLRNCVVPYA